MPALRSKKLPGKKNLPAKKFYTTKNISEKKIFFRNIFLRRKVKLSLRLLIKISIYDIKNIILNL